MKTMQPYRWEAVKTMARTGLHYLVRLQDYILKDNSGCGEASIFSFSYLKVPEDRKRPVVFAYNGGPGAASSWLHMGLLGPKILRFPGYPNVKRPAEYRLEDNPAFLLEVCDLVLIDPVGAAYARLLKPESASKYFSTGGDAKAFAAFLCAWLEENGRTAAPVYLLGESYGTIRNVALADVLPPEVNLKGIINIGTSLNVGAKSVLLVEPTVRRLGANAAACWYHHHKEEGPQEEFVQRAMEFAYQDYAAALLLGNRLPQDAFEKVLDKLHYFCGLNREFLRKNRLRFGEIDFLLGLCPNEVVSMYDSRLTCKLGAGESYAGNAMDCADIVEPDTEQDAFMSSVDSAFSQALFSYFHEELQIPEREYLSDMLAIGRQWDYRSYDKDTLELPVELMKKNQALRMMFVNGCYDLSSTFDFMIYYLSQYDLPADRVERLVLPAGHASYVGEGMAEKLGRHIQTFILRGKD